MHYVQAKPGVPYEYVFKEQRTAGRGPHFRRATVRRTGITRVHVQPHWYIEFLGQSKYRFESRVIRADTYVLWFSLGYRV
jgi:hypothetical protein